MWVKGFLASLRLYANVSKACRDVGIDRSTPIQYKNRVPEGEDRSWFARLWEEAVSEGADRLEEEAWRRATEGTERPVYQGGQMVGTVREFSDTLMVLLLKGHKPDKYRERASLEHSGPNGGPIEAKVYDASLAGRAGAITEILDAARARAAGATNGDTVQPT